jgi:lysozyme
MTALQAKQSVQSTLGVTPDGRRGLKTDSAYDRLFRTADDDPWPPMAVSVPPSPIPVSSGGVIDTIIDISHGNGMDIPKLKAAGICAIIHKVDQGTGYHDPLYQSRRAAAKAAGFLWGGYDFNSSEDPAAQARDFIATAKFTDDELMAFDWEEIRKNVTLDQAHVYIQTIFDLTGRYPMLYGSNVLREDVGDKPDALLAKCAYWHVMYRATPDHIPTQIWPTYDLWQFDDGTKVKTPGSDGADRNKFRGTEAELRAVWPFSKKIA